MIKEYPVLVDVKVFKLKRPHVHPSGIEDFGGAPKVLDFTQGQGEKLWDFDVDGALGNGTKAKVKASIYVPEKGSKTKGFYHSIRGNSRHLNMWSLRKEPNLRWFGKG